MQQDGGDAPEGAGAGEQRTVGKVTGRRGSSARNPDVVAVEARRIAETHRHDRDEDQRHDGDSPRVGRVFSLTERRLGDPTATIAALPADSRPLPTVETYDELPTRRRDPATTQNEVS